MTDARRHALDDAGWNVFNLDEADVVVDFATDMPTRSPFAPIGGTAFPAGHRREPDLRGLAVALYGDGRFVATTKGRAAELAVISEALPAGAVVVAHPLFMSVEHALVVRQIRQDRPPASTPGTSNLDLDWLAGRLAAGGIAAVILEPAANALGGLPLELDNAAAVARLCRRHDVRLLLDATRLLANCHALRMSPLLDAAKAFTAIADAYTVSCAKELLAPYGGLACVRDPARQRAIWEHCRMAGTLLEPHDQRVELARGIERVLRDPDVIARRGAQLVRLALGLRAASVSLNEPIGAHAVFAVIPDAIATGDAAHQRAVEAHIYLTGGIRVLLRPYPALPGHVSRLPVAIGRYLDAELDAVGPALRRAFDTLSDAARLIPVAHEELSPNRGRYRPC